MNPTNSETTNPNNQILNRSEKTVIQSNLLAKADKFEPYLFWILVLIGTLPIFLTKYYLTLDGPGHIYNGNIIKELWLGNYPEFANLFKFNQLPVPNWISHFLFACLNLVFPDFISEKIILCSYLILFPVFFRKIVLWFAPANNAFSYLGILFAHNHLLYLGSYNMVFAIVAFFATSYVILKHANTLNYKQILGLSLLFLIVYFSHMLILLVTMLVALFLPLAALQVEKTAFGFIVSNWNHFFTKLKIIAISIIPTFLLTGVYILNVDSLEEAGRINLKELLKWIVDVRPLLTLCYCADWKYFSHGLTALFLVMIGTNLFFLVKKNCIFSDNSLKISVPQPTFSLICFLLFAIFTILFLIVPNANILPERLIILVFLFLCFWVATQTYPRWVHQAALFIILVIHLAFSFYHTRSMRGTSRQIELMKEVSRHIEPGSLLLPFNYAYEGNWLHMHSPGYFGSGKPIAVIENYEGQLKWFPINWNMEGKYELAPINVWAADNKKMIDHFYVNAQNPDVFSLPQKDGKIQEIPYAVIFGKMPNDSDPDFQKIKPILDKSYELIFQNDFCWLYRLGKNRKTN